MRAARDWGARWTAFQGGDLSAPWSERDRAVSLALRVFEDGLCPGCGRPVDEVWRGDEYRTWQAESITCGACHAIESARQSEDEAVAKGRLIREPGKHWVAHRRGEEPLSARLRPDGKGEK